LDFKQSLHQLVDVFHDFLQGWVTDKIGDGKAENCSKVNTVRVVPFPQPHDGIPASRCAAG